MADIDTKSITDAKRKVVEGCEALWNARLQLLTNAGDLAALLQHLRSPVELAGDNCGCNSACGSLAAPGAYAANPGGTGRTFGG